MRTDLERTDVVKRWQGSLGGLGSKTILGALAWGSLTATAAANPMDAAITPIATEVNGVYNLILWITGILFVGIWTALGIALWKFRYRKDRAVNDFHGNLAIEVIWTVIPVILLIIISVPAFRVLQFTEYAPQDVSETVEVIGHQFFWEYRYPDAGITIANQPMRLPVGQNVRLLVTSDDVIHSFSVPAFGFKQDAIPGRVNERWVRVDKAGTYEGYCAQLCGALHAKMLLTVEALEPAAYAAWKAQNTQAAAVSTAPVTKESLTADGEKLYASNCASCHQPNGQGLSGVFPPLVGSERVTGDKNAHIDLMLNGLRGPIIVDGKTYNGVMPGFGHLKDHDLAAIATYERNAWGNDAGMVSPDEVKARRKSQE
jgi:cytochrome c oxidase subunit 2